MNIIRRYRALQREQEDRRVELRTKIRGVLERAEHLAMDNEQDRRKLELLLVEALT